MGVDPNAKGLQIGTLLAELKWDIIMVMAGPPSLQPKKSDLEPTALEKAVAMHLADGLPLPRLANQLAKKTGKPAKYWRQKLRHMAVKSQHVKDELFIAGQADVIMGVPGTAQAVVGRAQRGRIDAAKLVFSASGFYNEKVQHEHNGDIGITIKIARPEPVIDRTKRMDLEEGIVDADCVEE